MRRAERRRDGLRCLVVRLMPVKDTLAQLTLSEDRFDELAIKASVEAAVEDLLKNVEDDVVQEVVPGVLEEQTLRASG